MKEDLRQFALYYFNFGFNVTHIVPQKQLNRYGEYEYILKKPSHEIKNLTRKKQSIEDVLAFKWEEAIGIGAVMGFDNLRSIDIDGCTNEIFIYEFLSKIGLPNNYEWVVRTGSQNGFHIIFYADYHHFYLPKSEIRSLYAIKEYLPFFKHLELRWTNHIVLPPSLHVSEKNYDFWAGRMPSNPPYKVDIYVLERYIEKICQTNCATDEIGNYYENFLSDDYAFMQCHDSSGYKTGIYKEPYYFFIDIETNGLPDKYPDPKINPEAYPEIIQIATLCCDSSGKRVRAGEKYIIPDGWKIKEEVKEFLNLDETKMRYHGMHIKKRDEEPLTYYAIDPETLKYYEYYVGCFENVTITHLKDLFGVFYNFFDAEEVGYIIGHNTDYDLNCLEALCARNEKNVEFETFNSFINNYFLGKIPKMKKICTMKSTTEFCGITNKYGYKYPKLEELYFKLFNKKLEGAHDAKRDIFNTAKCYWKLRDLKQIE